VTTVPIPVNSSVTAIAVDAAGTLYYGGYEGLMMLPAGGTPSVLIRGGATISFGGVGSVPTVQTIDSIAVIGGKELCVLSMGQILRVTLP